MNITKDEARILAAALEEAKYKLSKGYYDNERLSIITSLENLEWKLRYNSEDHRRKGRTSRDDWHDMMRRFSRK